MKLCFALRQCDLFPDKGINKIKQNLTKRFVSDLYHEILCETISPMQKKCLNLRKWCNVTANEAKFHAWSDNATKTEHNVFTLDIN